MSIKYFYVNNYQIFPCSYQHSFEYQWRCAETLHEFDGRRYYVLEYDDYILYRVGDYDDESCTLFVWAQEYERTHYSTQCQYPEAAFREQVRGGQSGRFALHNCRQAHGVAALLFKPDGTGTFLDNGSVSKYGNIQNAQEMKETAIEFKWRGDEYGIPRRADILTCDPELLTSLCEDIIMEQVRPRMKDPYLSKEEYPDIPLEFACGSLEELLHITRCICHVDQKLLESGYKQEEYVKYMSTTPWRSNGFVQPTGHEKKKAGPNGLLSENGSRLCDLAFAHNAFRGATWEDTGYRCNERQYRTHLTGMSIVVCALPPSAHERAEALLTLQDWLEGKVTEAERQALLTI